MNRFPRFETLPMGILLAMAGGSLDCYTYLSRGQVFATAETGNLVLLGIRLAQGKISLAAHYLPPILAFMCGVLAAEQLRAAFTGRERKFDWRQLVLLAECAVVAAVAVLPCGKLDSLVNVLISFTSAMQVEGFRSFAGCACATTMCTGNLRSGTENLFLRLKKKDREAGRKAAVYGGIILAFVAGVVLCSLLVPHLGGAAAWMPFLLLAAALGVSFYCG